MFLAFDETEAPIIAFALGGLRLLLEARGRRAVPEVLDEQSLATGLEVIDELHARIQGGLRQARSGTAFEAGLVKRALHHVWDLYEMGDLVHADLPQEELYSDQFTQEQVQEHGQAALDILASVYDD